MKCVGSRSLWVEASVGLWFGGRNWNSWSKELNHSDMQSGDEVMKEQTEFSHSDWQGDEVKKK